MKIKNKTFNFKDKLQYHSKYKLSWKIFYRNKIIKFKLV